MIKNKNKGFTLIELLVVIAIIGVLASVVLASLNSARGKAKDAAIKANLANLRGQAEIYYEIPGNYGDPYAIGTCAENSPVGTLFESTKIQEFIIASGNISNGGGLERGTCASGPTPGPATVWAVSVPLFSDENESWCVDSQGASIQRSGPIGGTDCSS